MNEYTTNDDVLLAAITIAESFSAGDKTNADDEMEIVFSDAIGDPEPLLEDEDTRLYTWLKELPYEQLCRIAVTAWLGRGASGDPRSEEYEDKVQREVNRGWITPEYVAGIGHKLVEYLRAAMRKLGL